MTETGVTGIFTGMFDDAALFPPGNLPFADALPAHHTHHSAWYAGLAGPFVVPAARLDELAARIDGRPLRISLTMPDGPSAAADAVRRVAGLDSVELESVEVALPAGDSTDIAGVLDVLREQLPKDVLGYVEVPRDKRRLSVLDALTGTGYRAKFRTGGVVPEAHPGEHELAEAIAATVRRGLPFKCTAGLHHAVRHTDGGLEQHGFLNILLATEAALAGAGLDQLVVLLAQRDADLLVDAVERVGPDQLAAARHAFTSFGTCSITDPIGDLTVLGLLTPPRGDS